MAKSVYSVLLSDEVVAAIDRLAYREKTSRSKLIERVLAEYAGCDTPARQMADIFGQIEQMAALHEQLQLLLTSSGELLQLKSAVPYKYNPTVKYAVALGGAAGDLGELRVTLRSQSAGLLGAMGRFFALWCQLEQAAFQDGEFLSYRVEDGRYTRLLRPLSGASPADTGDAIADYIRLMDSAMQGYFSTLPDETAARRAIGATVGRVKNPNVFRL